MIIIIMQRMAINLMTVVAVYSSIFRKKSNTETRRADSIKWKLQYSHI